VGTLAFPWPLVNSVPETVIDHSFSLTFTLLLLDDFELELPPQEMATIEIATAAQTTMKKCRKIDREAPMMRFSSERTNRTQAFQSMPRLNAQTVDQHFDYVLVFDGDLDGLAVSTY